MKEKDRNKILALLFVGVFMGSLDIGIVGPALPAIKAAFGVDVRLVSWIFSIYILFFMIGTPLMAKLSDLYGRKTIYILDIFLFALGSIITVTSFSFETLLIGRAIQGFGAGGIFPVASAFIGDTFPPEKRGSALGLIGSVWGISGLLGPILGGLLLNYGWQWLFILNIPLAAIVIALGLKILPQSKKENNLRFDWYGTAVLALLASSLAYGVNQIDTTHFMASVTSIGTWPFLIGAIILLFILIKVERKADDPVIEVNLLKSREVKIATSISFGTGLNQTAIIFLPAFAVVILSLTISQASLMVIPLVVTLGISAPLIGRLLDKYGSKKIMLVGTIILFIGLFMLSSFASSFYLFIISGMIIGVGLSSILGSPLRYIMLSESPANKRASGQALININSSVGQLVGASLIGAVISSQGGTALGYQSAYILIGLVAVLMALLTLGLKKQKEQLATMQSNI